MLLAAGANSGLYKFVFVLHLIAAIAGFGGVVLNGVYGAQAKKRPGVGGLAISEANYVVSVEWAEKFIYAVSFLGVALVLVSDDAWKFSQTWVWLSLTLYLIAIGISQSVMIPSHRRLNKLSAELVAAGPPPAGGTSGPPPQVAEIEAMGQRLAVFGGLLNVILVVIIVLMVWKPGA